jgi:DMSO/TMAO reductase YedYZ molybdopterin-dependent catalytic subunit
VKIDFVAKQPRTNVEVMAAEEYGFYANREPTRSTHSALVRSERTRDRRRWRPGRRKKRSV